MSASENLNEQLCLNNLDTSLDGLNQWETISEGRRSSRNEFVYNIDDISETWAIRLFYTYYLSTLKWLYASLRINGIWKVEI